MRFFALIFFVILSLSSCGTHVYPVGLNNSINKGLSSCVIDEDCIPLPSSCHPLICINKAFEDDYNKPGFCTEIYVLDAAYDVEDCGCKNNVCINKKSDFVESDIPLGDSYVY